MQAGAGFQGGRLHSLGTVENSAQLVENKGDDTCVFQTMMLCLHYNKQLKQSEL